MMDVEKIEELIRLAKESAISELTVRRDGVSVSIKKPQEDLQAQAARPGGPSSAARSKTAPAEAAPEPAEAEIGTLVTAPMVGIFHMAEDTTMGVLVKAGQILGAIESMKLMNDVTAPSDGIIREVLVEDGMPVEYGQPLFRIAH